MSGHRVLFDLFKAPFEILDPGASGTIIVDRWGAVCNVVTAGAEGRTLAQPTKSGIRCTVALKTDGGNLTLTVTGGYNAASDTDITLSDAGDFVDLVSVQIGTAYVWRVTGSETA